MATAIRRNSVTRNYSFDRKTVERFEEVVPKGARSQVLEELMAKRVAEIEVAERNALIVAGLADMADVYAETERDWSPTDRENWPNP